MSPRRIILGGYSDDCHTIQVDELPPDESYSPFFVTISMPDGTVVKAAMSCNRRGWRCEITAPVEAAVTVRRTEDDRD